MRLSRTARFLLHCLNAVVIGFILLPILAAVVASLQSEVMLRGDLRSVFPKQITWDNYFILLIGDASREGTIYSGIAYLPDSLKRFGTALLNSTIISLSVTALTLILGSLTAYTVARLKLRWLTWFMGINIFARFVPLVVLIIPLYVILRQLGLVNSLIGVIIAETGFLLPFGILILVPYFASVPIEIEEAARVDGCSRFGTFLRITIPLSVPSLISLGTIIFIATWNDLLIPLVLNSRPEFMTVPVVLVSLIGDNAVFFGLLCACCLIAMLPTIVLVMLLQKYVVEGLTAGAVKA
jgi:multiple sugar transport system permease protein